jgi:hypothetical protein
MSMKHLVEWELAGETEVLGKKPAPVPLCPPQISQYLFWDRTLAAAVGSRRLTAWAMARSYQLLIWLHALPKKNSLAYRIITVPQEHTYDPILSQINPVHTVVSYFLKNYYNIILENYLFFSGILTEMYFLIHPLFCVTCHTISVVLQNLWKVLLLLCLTFKLTSFRIL